MPSHLTRRTFLARTGLAALAGPRASLAAAPAWARRRQGRRARARLHGRATTGKTVSLADYTRQDRRPRVDEPRLPVRAQALRERQHAGAPEGDHRAGRGLAHVISSAPGTQGYVTPARPTS